MTLCAKLKVKHPFLRDRGGRGIEKFPYVRDVINGPPLIKAQILSQQVNLTSPEILLFTEEMPEDKTMRNYYLQLQTHRMVSSILAS